MDVVWATAYDAKYSKKARPYIESLEKHGINPVKFTIDHLEVGGISVDSRYFKAPSPINCIQHGEFLQYIKDNPTVVFTDSDIVCQRKLSDTEQHFLTSMADGEIGVTYNNGEGDSLLVEALRLNPLMPLETILGKFPWIRHPMYMPCYNTGVLVATKATYEELYRRYCELYKTVDLCFSGYAKQQWLLSYIMETYKDLSVRLLPKAFHVHGCFNTVRPVDERFQFIDSTLYINTTTVLLRHNWMVPYWQGERLE